MDCMLLSPHPSLNTQKSLHSFGSAWFSSCEASSAFSRTFDFLYKRVGRGAGTCRRGGVPGRQTEPRDRRATAEMPPPLAWLDSSTRPGFTQMISETRPVRGGWLTDPGVPSLCSQES